MKHLNRRRTVRLVIMAALAVAALALWTAQSSAQQPGKPPFLLYGAAGEPGDVVSVYDANGEELGVTNVVDDGTWHVSITCAAEKVPTLAFQINGVAATPEISMTGADQAEVTLTLAADSDAMPEDDAMVDDEMSEDGDTMMESDGDMMEDEDTMVEDEDTMVEEDQDAGYPESGTGGLADTTNGPSTGALAGTIALLAALAATLGLHHFRKSRTRA